MPTIRFEQADAIRSIVLINPPFNRIGSAFANDLRAAMHRASESSIRVLVVRAEGPNFSFGGDAREWLGKDANWSRTFIAVSGLRVMSKTNDQQRPSSEQRSRAPP